MDLFGSFASCILTLCSKSATTVYMQSMNTHFLPYSYHTVYSLVWRLNEIPVTLMTKYRNKENIIANNVELLSVESEQYSNR